MFKRFAHVRQHDQADCGAASLATIAKHHGVHVSMARIRELVGTDRRGATMFGLMRGAEDLGFAAKGIACPYESLERLPQPFIAHWRNDQGFGHFIVVHKINGERITIADPARGIATLDRKEFCEHWQKKLLLLVPKNLKLEEKHTSKFALIRALLAPHVGTLAGAFGCSVLFAVLALANSFFMQHLVDSILVFGLLKVLHLAVWALAIALLFRALFGFVRSYFLADIARKLDITLVGFYVQHLSRLPMKFFDSRKVGDILARVNDAGKIRYAISYAVLGLIFDAMMLLVAIGAMLWINWSLALYSLLFVPLFPIVLFLLRASLAKKQREAMERAGVLESYLVETTTGMETVKTFAVGRQRVQEAESRLVQMAMTLFSVDRKRMVLDTAGLLASGLGTLLTLQAGAERVIAGQLTIGSLMFFYTLMGYMFGPIERLASSVVLVQDASVALERLWEVLSLDVEETPKKHPASVQKLRDGIRFKDVLFRYGYRGDVLKKINLYFPAGKTVALVGESGCGKSTVCKLLAKLYEVSEGQILIDDIDLRDFPAESWRRSFGYVGQEPYIFSGTVAENIAFGKSDASLEEIARAAQIAGLDTFIQRLPERYETMLGERGLNLSGGQRQRLAIARAIVLDPQIIIFDEASSHLDTTTEQNVFRSLFQSFTDRIVIIVAHRLSTVAKADIIYVIHDGTVSEHGDHETLLTRRGAYWKLCQAQYNTATAFDSPTIDSQLLAGVQIRSVVANGR